jgi:hypothetical protein
MRNFNQTNNDQPQQMVKGSNKLAKAADSAIEQYFEKNSWMHYINAFLGVITATSLVRSLQM